MRPTICGNGAYDQQGPGGGQCKKPSRANARWINDHPTLRRPPLAGSPPSLSQSIAAIRLPIAEKLCYRHWSTPLDVGTGLLAAGALPRPTYRRHTTASLALLCLRGVCKYVWSSKQDLIDGRILGARIWPVRNLTLTVILTSLARTQQ